MTEQALVNLNFPDYPIRLRKSDEEIQIFDFVRKKWLVCTPEEWVRQHFIYWLIEEKKTPAALISIESGLKINQLQRRSDVLVYRHQKPFLLAECKAPQVKITQKVFDQVFRYNLKIKADYILVTNGLTHFFACAKNESIRIQPIEELPLYYA